MTWQKSDFLCSHHIPTSHSGFGGNTVLILSGPLGFIFIVHFVAYNATTVKYNDCPFLSTKAGTATVTLKHGCLYSFSTNLKKQKQEQHRSQSNFPLTSAHCHTGQTGTLE